MINFRAVFTLRQIIVVFLITFLIFIGFRFIEFPRSTNSKLGLKLCPISPPNLIASFGPNITKESLESVEKHFQSVLGGGGYYKPPDCTARYRVAVIIPCRGVEYEEQIPILLKNLHPMMVRQQLEYQIFVVFQTPGFRFNKGALANAGYLEVMKLRHWDCIIFHDVDTIPTDDRNMYDCPIANPRHLAVELDKFDFK